MELFKYRAFGLTIQSDIEFSELADEAFLSKAIDLKIETTNLGVEIPNLTEAEPFIDFEAPDGVTMVWPGAAAIRIRSNQHVEVQKYPNVPENYMAFPILGPVMGWILHQRGKLVLHSSAVVIDDVSFAFLGDKMAGKSTTASAFLRNGAKLITDDLLVIDINDGAVPTVQPSFAQLKLNENSAEHVSPPDSHALPLVMEGFEKRQYRLETMVSKTVPLDACFILRRCSETPQIEWLSSSDALKFLIRFSYFVRFGSAPSQYQERALHFKNCVTLTQHTQFGILNIPASLNELDKTVEVLRNEMRRRLI